jgi:Ca-activated chloride channel homolog
MFKSGKTLLYLLVFTIGTASGVDGQVVPKSAVDSEELKMSRNILITDPDGTLLNDISPSGLKIFEDGQEQKISGLRLDPSPLSLVMVVDNTGSMRPFLDQVIDTAKLVSRSLPLSAEVQVIRFVNRSKIENWQPWTTNRRELDTAIDNFFIESGQSAVVDALMLGLSEIDTRRKRDPKRRFAVLLISDGEDRESYFNKSQLRIRAEAAGVPFHIVAFPNELPARTKREATRFIHDLALVAGGSTYFPRSKENAKVTLSESLKELIGELRSQYVLSYVPTNQYRDGKERAVKVEKANAENKWLVTVRSIHTVPEQK